MALLFTESFDWIGSTARTELPFKWTGTAGARIQCGRVWRKEDGLTWKGNGPCLDGAAWTAGGVN